MTKSDKFIAGATITIGISALCMYVTAKNYDSRTQNVEDNLQDIKYMLSKTREDVLEGNREIVEGNKILKTMVKNAVNEGLAEKGVK